MLTDKYLWCSTQNFVGYSDIAQNIKVIENNDVGSLCRIFEYQEVLYIQFEGTQFSLKDLLIDMFFFKKKLYSNVKMHAGFWTAVESIWEKVVDYVIHIARPYSKVVVFGHSMGAAMAKECVRRLRGLYPLDKIKVITFGTPRTGNKYYAELFDDYNMIEYMMRSDIVGKLPPKIFNYAHTKHIKYIGKTFVWDAHHKYGEYL